MARRKSIASVVVDTDSLKVSKKISIANNSEGLQEFAKYADKEVTKIVKHAEKQINKKIDEKTKRLREFRKEASRLVSMANKRLKRLEKSDFTDSPAYQYWKKTGGEKFSVKGKDYNQLQQEVARMRGFIDARTSTVRGATSYIKEIAKNTGIKYSSFNELKSSIPKFFELASKTEQYLRSVEDSASAIGYQKIWTAVNTYVKKNRIELNDINSKLDELIKDVSDALMEYEKPESVDMRAVGINDNSKWFKLPKD